jgi:hypothetical protein
MTTIIEASRTHTLPYVGQLMKKLVENRPCMSLLRFFAAHPNGRFSQLAIVHALIDEAGSRREVEMALTQMMEERLLTFVEENKNSLYMLTKDETMRRLVINMSLFDWRDWQLVLEHT